MLVQLARASVVIAVIALSACAEPQEGAAVQDACTRAATHDVTWSNSNAPDTLTASAVGPTCAQAVVTLVARNADGDPLWTIASTYYDMTAGGVPPDGAPAVTTEQVDTFLAGWADVTIGVSTDLPEWRAGVATLTESASTFAYETPFDRETYEMLRQRNLPMLCYAVAVEASQCLIIDPASNAPTMIVAYGP